MRVATPLDLASPIAATRFHHTRSSPTMRQKGARLLLHPFATFLAACDTDLNVPSGALSARQRSIRPDLRQSAVLPFTGPPAPRTSHRPRSDAHPPQVKIFRWLKIGSPACARFDIDAPYQTTIIGTNVLGHRYLAGVRSSRSPQVARAPMRAGDLRCTPTDSNPLPSLPTCAPCRQFCRISDIWPPLDPCAPSGSGSPSPAA